MASRVQEGGGGMGSSGGFKAAAKKTATKVAWKVAANSKVIAKGAAISRNSVKAKEAKAAVRAAASKPPLATPKSGVKVVPKPTTVQDKLRNQALRSRFDYRTPVKNQMIDIENSMARARNAGEIKPKVIKINNK